MFITISKKNIASAALVVLLCGTLVFASCNNLFTQIKRTVATAGQERKLPIYSVNTDEKKIALGINCAWDADDIPLLIEILQAEDVKASFFVAGSWVTNYPEALAALAAAGHEIGSHSNSHRDMTTLTAAQITEEANTSAELIKNVTGSAPTLFRMPSGSYNNQVIETLEGLGYYTIQWDLDSVDWKNPTVEEMSNKILMGAAPGTITLFHSGAQNTPETLKRIIPQLKAQGYTFVPVGELIYKSDYYIDHAGKQFSTVK